MSKEYSPCLVAPAGNMEKLRIAFEYGADAVYLAGPHFGLRKSADNFSVKELGFAVRYAKDIGKRVYVTLNTYPHDSEIPDLENYLSELDAIAPHALIISDLGVCQLAKSLTSIPIHTSTQASVTNTEAAKFWKSEGACRVVLAREISIEDAAQIQSDADIEVELFVHGASCASYSGKCVISNYAAGRDSNRGGCIQSCRHSFQFNNPQSNESESAYIMNAKDLNAMAQIPQLCDQKIAAFKIEGRMKSNLYLANTVRLYRYLIDEYLESASLSQLDKAIHLSEAVSNRGFSSGGLEHRPAKAEISYEWNGYHRGWDFVGTVQKVNPDNSAYIHIKQPLKADEPLLCLTEDLDPIIHRAPQFESMTGETLDKVAPNTVIKSQFPFPLRAGMVLAKAK